METMKKELEKNYNPKDMEARIYQNWIDKNYFHATVDRSKKPFTIVMPPPNITGQLHMGHALDNTMQDILTRFKRMQGYNALWMPGTDHASIATEAKVVEKLKEEGLSKEELDMGSPFDFFSEISHSDYTKGLTNKQIKNRKLLKDIMINNGFKPLYSEWWHFTLEDEPYKDTYFEFSII